jgi:hypothetical protein
MNHTMNNPKIIQANNNHSMSHLTQYKQQQNMSITNPQQQHYHNYNQ